MKIVCKRPALLRPRKYESVSYIFRSWARWISILTAALIMRLNPRRKHQSRNKGSHNKKERNFLSSVHARVMSSNEDKISVNPKMAERRSRNCFERPATQSQETSCLRAWSWIASLWYWVRQRAFHHRSRKLGSCCPAALWDSRESISLHEERHAESSHASWCNLRFSRCQLSQTKAVRSMWKRESTRKPARTLGVRHPLSWVAWRIKSVSRPVSGAGMAQIEAESATKRQLQGDSLVWQRIVAP